MKGVLNLVFLCLFADFTDAAVTGWTATGFTVTAGSGASVTLKKTAKVAETKTADTVIMTLTAEPSATYTYAFTAAGNPGSVAKFTAASATAAEIKVDTGKSIDYETTQSLVFVVTATPATAGATVGTATVTVDIQNVVEFSGTHYVACVADKATAGTTVGTYTVADKASGDTIAYTHSPTTDFDYASATGVVTVKTTRDMKTLGGQALTLTATPAAGSTSAVTAGTTTLWIAIGTCTSSALQITAMLGMVMLSFATALCL
ncbi:uncharacterized protein LOC127864665 [Dreissena polymorpha]|uniref:Uncharacterized protein n=1 Tax=Dreissena polymorpha TaxID=45954 RepID=A0A9D4SBA3_DREPO|nr:uncharacterized protein LOC127864665 [Dreissena polymorpha]KAH3897525.1 hypothetical protein DPMN_021713 [Dreissena polymorpha]